MTKIYLRITAKSHTHIQTLTKTPAKFQKDLAKMVGVAFLHSQDTQCLYALVEVEQKKLSCDKNLSEDYSQTLPGRVAQSVTCLATDACLTADQGVASLIPAPSHTFVEIDHEIISTVILLPSADSFKKGCCQLQAKVCAQITG